MLFIALLGSPSQLGNNGVRVNLRSQVEGVLERVRAEGLAPDLSFAEEELQSTGCHDDENTNDNPNAAWPSWDWRRPEP